MPGNQVPLPPAAPNAPKSVSLDTVASIAFLIGVVWELYPNFTPTTYHYNWMLEDLVTQVPLPPAAPNAPKLVSLDTVVRIAFHFGAMWTLYTNFTQTWFHYDWVLRDLVTAPYNPPIPNHYVERGQQAELKQELHKAMHGNSRFFMLVGESGSGKTVAMQKVLRDEYGEGVVKVDIDTADLAKDPAGALDLLESAMLKPFEACTTHEAHNFHLNSFIAHANKVRKQAVGEKAHSLILYITLDSKDSALTYHAMEQVAAVIGQKASTLNNPEKRCNIIVEVSQIPIWDTIQTCAYYNAFEVNAMTVGEFLQIGKMALGLEDPENLMGEYLTHHHNWLGGHVTTLQRSIAKGDVGNLLRSATSDTREEIMHQLKAGIIESFKKANKLIDREGAKEKLLLEKIAATGMKGIYIDDNAEDRMTERLLQRDSNSTLLRVVGDNVRIHRYSHALYLHGVTGPHEPNVTDKIKDVKGKFGMHEAV